MESGFAGGHVGTFWKGHKVLSDSARQALLWQATLVADLVTLGPSRHNAWVVAEDSWRPFGVSRGPLGVFLGASWRQLDAS